MQSIPTLSTKSNDLKLAVRRAVPAKTSNAKTWLICFPEKEQPWVKLWWLQRWSWSEWGLKHPGSAHKWTPLGQLSPALALLHPFGRLYAQHNRCFCGVSNALLMSPAGVLGPRLLPDRPFGLPLPFGVCCLRWLRDFLLGFEAFGADGTFGVLPANGRRWKATLGWLNTSGSRRSNGSWFNAFLLGEVIRSDRNMKAALSALKTCCTETAE